MKKILIITAILFTAAVTAKAQDTLEATIGTDLVSQYVWRGQDLGDVSVQPFDLTLAYTVGGFNIGVTDYWFNAGLDPLNRYFAYAADCTNHVFEANVGYDFGFASLQWYTNFAGNDGLTPDEKRAYSSYVEVNVPFVLGGVDWTATAGAVPFATDFYGVEGFGVVNVALTASKDIRITDSFSIPVFAQVAANPYSRNAFFVFGITLQP